MTKTTNVGPKYDHVKQYECFDVGIKRNKKRTHTNTHNNGKFHCLRFLSTAFHSILVADKNMKQINVTTLNVPEEITYAHTNYEKMRE